MVIPPPGLDALQASALVAHGLTAALVLRKAAQLEPGQTLLIEAAAGGLGSFAVQLVKLYGAVKVIAATSTPEKHAYAERVEVHAVGLNPIDNMIPTGMFKPVMKFQLL